MATDFLGNGLEGFRVQTQTFDEAGEVSGTLYNYYGYTHRSGQIIIMRSKKNETSYKYANGGFGDFDTVWATRQNLTYKYWNKL